MFSAGSVQEGRVYRASLSSAGKEPEASLQTVVWGKVMPNSFNLAALVETEDHAPQLWIHTDWPFAWIESRFLRKGTYQVVNKDAAPYVLRILGKTPLPRYGRAIMCKRRIWPQRSRCDRIRCMNWNCFGARSRSPKT